MPIDLYKYKNKNLNKIIKVNFIIFEKNDTFCIFLTEYYDMFIK